MRLSTLYIGVLATIFLVGCTAKKAIVEQNQPEITIDQTEVIVTPLVERGPYQASEKRDFDLIHTRLSVSFDWENAYCIGQATLVLKPYFYDQSVLKLDARGFDIKKIALVENETIGESIAFTYDGEVITIPLGKSFTREDEVVVFIDYVAKPNELEEGGSSAITSDKGLYFINNKGEDPNKPMQIWTQGETQSNSCWFPTIDKPNERMTQEIKITIDSAYKTLSNGELEYSILNGDGTRTDYWRQDLPHAPYLAMMAIGRFTVVKDSWRDMEVNYYVEAEYESSARLVWGKTPEMLDFFSKKLGVDYPWSKYSQVVVRDFVSGAMENTTASTFFEQMNITEREYLDQNHEDIIAHELFHQWFGDLVTCESWSNLPLNESFATYGEYLWFEHKYGRAEADKKGNDDLSIYFQVARNQKVDMIRYDYSSREEMFDVHSYQKGGRILHMLRKYVGDEAFFTALNQYLKAHKFNSVEIHDLRLAFEKVTGEDLNWFFNQWFLNQGHPELEFESTFLPEEKAVQIITKQIQNLEENPLYKLPLDIDLYSETGKVRRRIWVEQQTDTTLIPMKTAPVLVNFDAEKTLVGKKVDPKSADEWLTLFNRGELYLDKIEALEGLVDKPGVQLNQAVSKALSDPFWNIRRVAVNMVDLLDSSARSKVYPTLVKIAESDDKSAVRSSAITALNKNYPSQNIIPIVNNGLKDMSYSVNASSLNALADRDYEAAYKEAKSLETVGNSTIRRTICSIYGKQGSESDHAYFLEMLPSLSGFEPLFYLRSYQEFLKNKSAQAQKDAADMLNGIYGKTSVGFLKGAIKGNFNTLAGNAKAIADNTENSAENIAEAKSVVQYIEKLKSSME
jgi:aminopeptidase N